MEYGFCDGRPQFFSDKVSDYPSFPANYQNYYGCFPQTPSQWNPSALPSKKITNNQFQLSSKQINDSASWSQSVYPVTQTSHSHQPHPIKLPSALRSEGNANTQFQLHSVPISNLASWNPSVNPVTQRNHSFQSHTVKLPSALSSEANANNQFQLNSEQITNSAAWNPSVNPITQTSHSFQSHPLKLPSALPSEANDNQFQLHAEQISDSASWNPSVNSVMQTSHSFPSHPVKLPSALPPPSEANANNQFQQHSEQISNTAIWNPSVNLVTQTSHLYPSHPEKVASGLPSEANSNNQFQLRSEQISDSVSWNPSVNPVTQTSHLSHPQKVPSALPSKANLNNQFQLDAKKISENLSTSKPLPTEAPPRNKKLYRKKYTTVTSEKRKALIRAYNANPYISGEEKKKLAQEIGEPTVYIEKWYANRRYLEQKKQKEGFAKIEILNEEKYNRSMWIPMENTVPPKAKNMTLESIVAEAVSTMSPDSGISSGPVTPVTPTNSSIEELNRSRYNDDFNDLLDAVAPYIPDPVWTEELPILDDWVVAQELDAVERYNTGFTM